MKYQNPLSFVWKFFSVSSGLIGIASLTESVIAWKTFIPKIIDAYQTLYAAIRAQGFNGKYTQFCHNMNRFIKPEKPSLPRLPPIEIWSNSKLSFMVLQQQDELTAKDRNFLDFLYQKAPQIKATAELTKNFKNLFLNKAEGTLQDWLTRALDTTSELQGFAKGHTKRF